MPSSDASDRRRRLRQRRQTKITSTTDYSYAAASSSSSAYHHYGGKVNGGSSTWDEESGGRGGSSNNTNLTNNKTKIAMMEDRLQGQQNRQQQQPYHPTTTTTMSWVMVNAVLYVLSGVTQPILMAYAKHAGLANPRCQLYMLFYYIGPASVAFSLRRRSCRPRVVRGGPDDGKDCDENVAVNEHGRHLPYEEGGRRNNGDGGGDDDERCAKCDDDPSDNGNNGSTMTSSYYGSTSKSIIAASDRCDDVGYGKNNGDGGDTAIETNDAGYEYHEGGGRGGVVDVDEYEYEDTDDEGLWPSRPLLIKASAIALFDIFAQSMCYTGNNMAGPTIFSIIYSSVTIWAALYSKLLLSRSLSRPQWAGVCLVVLGLSLTARDSSAVGDSVLLGACLVLVGSSFHGLTYVFSEMIMTKATTTTAAVKASKSDVATTTVIARGVKSNEAPPPAESHRAQRLWRPGVEEEPRQQHISVRANCAIQGIVATLALLAWQVVYTLPRLQSAILDPMADAGTSVLGASAILGAIALANLLHSVTFFSTLKNFPGGATSAGVLKGLQAVLVFALTSVVLCGRWGGAEMCWSRSKLECLVVVLCGILLYGAFTTKEEKEKKSTATDGVTAKGLSLRWQEKEECSGLYREMDDDGIMRV